MMKRSELAFVLALVPFDFSVLVGAFALAYFTRLQSGVIYVWDFPTFLRFVLGFTPFWILLFAIEGLYRIRWSKKIADEAARVFLAVSSAVMLVVAWIFLSRTEFFSRLVVFYAWIYAFIGVLALRVVLRAVQRYLLRYGIGVHRVAVIGSNGTAHDVISHIQRDRSLGFKLMKVLDRNQAVNLPRIPWIKEIDEIILADTAMPEQEILHLIEFCEERRIVFRMIPNLFRVHALNVDVAYLHGIPILEFRKSPLGGWWRIIKRLVDVVFSLAAMIALSPLFVTSALAVKLTTPGPVLYRNKRVGPNGIFDAFKLRTLYLEYCTGDEYGGKAAAKLERKLIRDRNTRKGGIYKIKDDPRVTTLGQFLRQTSIDEIPQLLNVLKGDMSLVGPRPHQPREVKHYHADYQKLLHVKPGITGLAQISGRSDLDTNEEVKLDAYYVENWSLWLDIQILLRTPIALLNRRQVA